MITIFLEIQAQIMAYWHDVDRNWGRNAHLFFIPDGRYTTSQKSRTGRAEIQQFYLERERRGERVVRHLVHNLHLASHTDTEAQMVWVLLIHANDGVPVLPASVPNLIADVTDDFVRDSSGRWLLKERTIAPLFKGPIATTG